MRWIFCGLTLVALVALMPRAQAQACFSSYCSRYEEGECVETTSVTCSPSSQPNESYGAIAYGAKSRAYGYSYSWGSRAKAENVAMKNCFQHGNDCEIMVWFDRRCGAVAQGNGDAFWGLSTSAGGAKNAALSRCQQSGAKACAIQVSACSE